jgi:hypothetical protein
MGVERPERFGVTRVGTPRSRDIGSNFLNFLNFRGTRNGRKLADR